MLPPFPLDDASLELLFDASLRSKNDDGTYDGFTLSRLLDFLSGYNPGTGVWDGEDDVWESYSERDVIRALIHEVRRLRMTEALR